MHRVKGGGHVGISLCVMVAMHNVMNYIQHTIWRNNNFLIPIISTSPSLGIAIIFALLHKLWLVTLDDILNKILKNTHKLSHTKQRTARYPLPYRRRGSDRALNRERTVNKTESRYLKAAYSSGCLPLLCRRVHVAAFWYLHSQTWTSNIRLHKFLQPFKTIHE